MADRTNTSDAAPALRERLVVGAVSVSPMLTFTVLISTTKSLTAAACAALIAAVTVSVWRVLTGRPARTTVAVIAGVVLQVTFATVSGDAVNFFLPRLAWMVLWSPMQLVLILIGRAPLGWAVARLRGQPRTWRQCSVRRRAYSLASLLPWSLATLEMVVALWLYAHDRVALLGGTEVVTNVVHLLAFVAAWRIAVRLIGTHDGPDQPGACGCVAEAGERFAGSR